MTTWKELVYMVLDELKIHTDDAKFTEDHVIFLLSKYRAFILKQRYADIRKQIPESNYQTICFDLIEVPAISGEPCEGGSYLRSSIKIPTTMTIGNPKVYPIDYYQGEITFVSRERMKYVGYNRFLPNIIYCSLGPDNYLYFKSPNPQYQYLEKVKMNAIFEDSDKAAQLDCNNTESFTPCDILDREFPMEEALIPPVIELVLKDLTNGIYKPSDNINDAQDALSDLAGYLRRNMKSQFQKQIDE